MDPEEDSSCHVLAVGLGLMLQSLSQNCKGASQLPPFPFSSAELAQQGREAPEDQAQSTEKPGDGRALQSQGHWLGWAFSRCMSVFIFEVQESTCGVSREQAKRA